MPVDCAEVSGEESSRVVSDKEDKVTLEVCSCWRLRV